jgi:hypothetical protein
MYRNCLNLFLKVTWNLHNLVILVCEKSLYLCFVPYKKLNYKFKQCHSISAVIVN